MFAIIERGDLVAASVTASAEKLPAIPPALADKPLGELRYHGGRVKHLSEFSTFYVDADGRKRVEKLDPSWPAVTCAWDAVLMRDGASWRVQTAKDGLKAHAAAVRFARETGGITVAGARILTDRESQGLIAGAMLRAQMLGDAASFRFKAASGFVTLTGAEMQALAVAVGEHVQACFALEADVLAEIEAGTITTKEAIEQRFAAL